MGDGGPNYGSSIDSICTIEKKMTSKYFEGIKTQLTIDDETYDAKANILYLQDSAIYFNAVNTGFEIIRGAVWKDSIMIINRLDKTVFIRYFNSNGYQDPVQFKDIELVLLSSVKY